MCIVILYCWSCRLPKRKRKTRSIVRNLKGKFEANGEKRAKNIRKGREKAIMVDWAEEYLERKDIMVIVINIKEMEEIMIMVVSDQDLREIIQIMGINDQNKVEIITVNLFIRKGIVVEGLIFCL